MSEPSALRRLIAEAIQQNRFPDDTWDSQPAALQAEYLDCADAVLAVILPHLDWLGAEVEDQRAAKRIAAEAADRFRDVVCEALGYPKENPGDDVLVAELRASFGKTGPEPTAWRNRLAGYEAIRDQINAAAHNAGPSAAEAAAHDRAYWEGKYAGEGQ